MKKFIKAICFICCLSLVLTVCAACGNKGTTEKKPYVVGVTSNITADQKVENERFSMSFDPETANIMIADKQTGDVYSQIPYDYYTANRENMFIAQNNFMPGVAVPDAPADLVAIPLYSPIYITALEGSTNVAATYYANVEVFIRGRVASQLLEDGTGIRVTYFFDALQIYVPVDYTIDEAGFNVQVVPTDIVENNDEYSILTVSMAPMFCSAVNNGNSYLVIPSGSGALMNTDVRTDSEPRTYSAEVYGQDLTIEEYEILENSEEIHLPVFGVVEDDRAVCAIVESGSEKCVINAQAGDPLTGYSSAWVTGYVRGYNRPVAIILAGRIRIRTHIKEELTSKEPIKVSYEILSGESASYTGIANRYSRYLVEKMSMSDSAESTLLHAQLLGSFRSDELFLGIPYKQTRALTTYKQASDMVTELSKLASGDMSVDMIGFGSTGVDIADLAGDFTLTGKNGNKKALKNFLNAASEAGADTYFDFDVVRFTKGSGGLSDTAVTANNAPAKQYSYNLGTKLREMDDYYYLLQRGLLNKAANKAVGAADKLNIEGVSLGTLGYMAYSDYVDSKYYNKEGIQAQVAEILTQARESGKKVLVNEANDYAAVCADIIVDVPTKSDMSFSFDREIPFYQIVFKGYVDFAQDCINLAENDNTQFLKSIECGTGLSFALTAEYSADTILSGEKLFYSTLYEDNLPVIGKMVSMSQNYLSAVKSAKIKAHSYITDNVVKTVFDNGVYVYVNYGDAAVSAEGVNVPAQGFAAFTKEGNAIG